MAKLLGVGTRVKLMNTPDKGLILEKLGDGLVLVRLDDGGMEIPIFEDDLVREEHFMAADMGLPTEWEDVIKSKQKAAEMPQRGYKLTKTGVHLAFLPLKNSREEIEKFDILLLNDTAYDVVYEFDLVVGGNVRMQDDGLLKKTDVKTLCTILFDDVNDLPEIDLGIAPVYTEGVVEKYVKTLKIKPKQFFKNNIFVDFLGKNAHYFPVFEKFEQEQDAAAKLQDYTESILKNKPKPKGTEKNTIEPRTSVSEYASFVPEIDLHIEMLFDNPSKLSNNEIVEIQLKHCDAFLAKAIRLGVPRVWLIHGLGSGRLKELIAARLRRNTQVVKHKNEYHEKYGWGATEVILSKW